MMAFFGAPLVILSWGISAILGLILALVWAIERAWRRALSTLILPLTAFAALLNMSSVWGAAIFAGDYLHLLVMRSAYLSEISRQPSDHGPRLMVFDWGGFAGVTHAAVYDESDEVALPADKQSAAWKKRAAHTLLNCGVWGSPVGGHFYLVRIGC